MLPFALSIFAGAFLLFAVQPVIGKFILPWFGGGPGVWTTCLLFFQSALLGGYAYAHWSGTRLTPRRQVWVHLLLLVAAIATLPIIPGARWQPTGGAEPIGRILLVLAVSVGLPYFVLSATGPLLQHWFSQTEPGRSPYRLYALSNLGSLLALLGYPFLFEPRLSRAAQAGAWSVGLVGFALACSWCALRRWRQAAAPAVTVRPPPASGPRALDRLLWFALAATASILLLATTNKLCQDIAAVPFLWILPLALYLVSFILCFDHPRWYSRPLFSALFALGALVDVYLLFAGHNARLSQQIAGYSLTLFAACMLCHGEIFALRPAPAQLTSFYLHVAAGGAAGAAVVALLAPLVFDRYLELQLGLWLLSYFLAVVAFRQRSLALGFGLAGGAFAATFVLPLLQRFSGGAADRPSYDAALVGFYREHWSLILFLALAFALGAVDRRGLIREWRLRFGNFLLLFCLGLGILLVVQVRRATGEAVATSRDFYGVLKVLEHNPADPDTHYFTLVHGVTSHGLQFANPPKSAWPTTYYTESSGVGLALDYFLRDPRHPARRIGLVGLGTGTVAAYGGPQDTVRIYEIDPQVRRLAETRFSYVTHAPAHVAIVLGDARLSLEQERRTGPGQNFDVLALDAFSSDAIPIHLLTREAFATYVAHLSPDGVIAVHTSNRYLDLQPVVEALARAFGLQSVVVSDDPPAKRWWAFRSTWILLTRNQAFLDTPPLQQARADYTPPRHSSGLWTDDHASIFSVLKLR
jgi:spermidine synthase